MSEINMTSLINNPIREVRFPGFRNTFVIGKMYDENSDRIKFIFIDRQTMTVVTDSYNIADLIYRMSAFLAHHDQDSLDEYIRLLYD